MALFGIETWSSAARRFSVYFGMFASLAAFEVREATLGVRRLLSRLTRWAAAARARRRSSSSRSRATTFDGAQEGRSTSRSRAPSAICSTPASAPTFALRVTNSLFFALTLAFVAGVFWLGVRGMQTVRGSSLSLDELGRKFVHGFIPIALAYLTAHYFSLSSSRSRPSSPICSPTRSATGRTCSGSPRIRSTTALVGATSSGTSRSGRWSSAT